MAQFVWLSEMCSVFLWLILVVWVLRNWENNSAKLVMLHLRRCFDEGFSLSVEISESVLKCLSSRSTVTVMRTIWEIICKKISLDIFGRQLNLFLWLYLLSKKCTTYECGWAALWKSFGENVPVIRSSSPSTCHTSVGSPYLSFSKMDCKERVGRCFIFLFLAVLFDVAGLVLLLVGIFAPIDFWDLLVLSGPIIIFLSLVFWIFWYLGNLTVPYRELLPKWAWTGGGIWTGEIE